MSSRGKRLMNRGSTLPRVPELAIDSSDRVSNYADHFRYLADLSSFYQGPESRYSISLRYEAGALSSIVEDGEYSRIGYLSDPKIWSPEVIDTYFDLKNPFSDDRSLALDLRYASKARFILEGELETGLTCSPPYESWSTIHIRPPLPILSNRGRCTRTLCSTYRRKS